MTRERQPPLNLKLVKLTPKWAFTQRARRGLVVALYAAPITASIIAALGNGAIGALFVTIPLLLSAIVFLLWLVGATQARADLPDEYLDEREIKVRNEVFLNAFRILMALISIAFIISEFLAEFARVRPVQIIGLLFFLGLFLPTAIMAWTQPDPLRDLE
jgi:hypothetical protein